jgi:hypothetical protein
MYNVARIVVTKIQSRILGVSWQAVIAVLNAILSDCGFHTTCHATESRESNMF